MPIAKDFPEGLKPIGKISYSDGENFHFVWGSGRSDAEAFKDEKVQATYKALGEKQTPLGVSRTMVAVDWDSCVADGDQGNMKAHEKTAGTFTKMKTGTANPHAHD